MGVFVTETFKSGVLLALKERSLGRLLVIILLTQKLVSIVQCQFNRVKARFALWP
jgi:hypothetical protein